MQDAALVLSENQAITASAASANIVFEDTTVNTGYSMIAEFTVTEDFAGGTSITFSVEAGKEEEFTNKVTLGSSGAVLLADLKKGKKVRVPFAFNPHQDYGYMRAYYTAEGEFTGGKVTAVIQPAVQTNMED